MDLTKSLLQTIDLTQRLEKALGLGHLDLCQDLLDLRGEAMAAFERCHSQSSPSERRKCQDLLEDLKAADGRLQQHYRTALDSTAKEFRESLTSGGGVPSGGYAPSAGPACLDRKA